MLRAAAGRNSTQMVRIAFPVASEPAALEERLKKDGRADVYGIDFDFSKSTLRSESERVLDEIATALKNNPTWTGTRTISVATTTTWICRDGVRRRSRPRSWSAIAARQLA